MQHQGQGEDRRQGRGLARDVQERDTQPSYRDRAVRRSSNMSRRSDKRPAFRQSLRVPGYESDRRCRPEDAGRRHAERQASAAKDHDRSRSRIQLVRQPDRTCHRSCRRSLPRQLRCQKNGDRSGSRGCTCRSRDKKGPSEGRRYNTGRRQDRP